MISDQTDCKKKYKKFSVKCRLVEDGVFKCEMALRDFVINKRIVVDTVLEAKMICGDEFWAYIFKSWSLNPDVKKSFGILGEKNLVTSKPRCMSSSKKCGVTEKILEIDSELFLGDKVTFRAVGLSTDKKLAGLFGELCLLAQINDYFMFSSFVRWTNREIFEINLKGAMNESIPSNEFFEMFPTISDNVIEMPDGRMVCLLCKQVNRARAFALHNHTKIRRKLHDLHYCIVNSDATLASAVSRNLTVLWRDQEEIGKFVSEYKSLVLKSAREALAKHIPNLKLSLFGQSEEGMGQCYYILTINVSSSLKSQQLLDAMLLSLSEDAEHFRYIKDEFNDANPNVKASHITTCLDCIFYVKHESSVELSKFLKYCVELSAEVATLSTLFNFWSSHCKLDLPDSGYLHPTVFPIMVIYFLQHAVTPPRFPNLDLDQLITKIKSSSDNPDSSDLFDAQLASLFERARRELGNLPPVQTWKLWLLLLQFYWIDFNYFHKISLQLKAGGDGALLPLVRDDFDKDYARLSVAHPLRGRTSNISFSMKTHHAQIYYFDCFKDTLNYYHREVDQSKVKPSNAIQLMYPSHVKKSRDGDLCREIIVTDQSTDSEMHSVDPELARTEDSPDLSTGLCINLDSTGALESTATADSSSEVTGLSEEPSVAPEEVLNKPEKRRMSNDSGSNSEGEGNNPAAPGSPEAEECAPYLDAVTVTSINVPQVLLSSLRYTLPQGDNASDPLHSTTVSEEEIECQRQSRNFIRSPFTAICGLCRERGHTKANCPKEVLPPVLPVSVPGRGRIRELNEGLLQLVDSHKMSVKESERRELLRNRLESEIRSFMKSDFDLCLFGSSINKFGNDESDVDLCLVLQPPIEELPLDKILTLQDMEEPDLVYLMKLLKLEEIKKELHTMKEYQYIILIPAKVPLIRFEYMLGEKNYGCDISISNSLALNNSRLLATYACFDQRVQDLGLLVKHFGKVKGLADASVGGLSSYAYILLTIHFLQRTDPPIIPVLQQVRPPGYEHSSLKVGEWECYFCDDIKAVKQTWKHKQNNQNLAELWLEFLCYCVSKFNWEKHVITLRQLEPIPKVDKDWTNRKIGIEDPFNLKHNLGTVLSFRNAVKLRKCFIEAREFYHKPRNITDYLKWLDFDVKSRSVKISKSPPPVDPPDPEPEEPALETPASTETVLLSWSMSLESYCTQKIMPSAPVSDIRELSQTVLLPSSEARAAVASDPQVAVPSGVIKYINLREDILLLSGSSNEAAPESHINGVIASPFDQLVRPSELNTPPPAQSHESDSLSLDELTKRVAQASLDIIQAPSDLHSLPFPQALSAQNRDLTPSNQDQQSPPLPSDISTEQDKDAPVSFVARNQSPVGIIPHGAKGLQPHTSPGFKIGRGSIRPPPIRHEEDIPPAHYKQHSTGHQMQQDTRGAPYGRHKGQHRPPRRDFADPLEEYNFNQMSSHPHISESYLPQRGTGRSARGRGRSNSHRKLHYKYYS